MGCAGGATPPRSRAHTARASRAPSARSVHGRDRQVQHILDRAPAHRAAQRLAAAPLQPAATACCGVGGGGLARAGVAAGAAAARGCVLLRQRRRVQTLSSAIVSAKPLPENGGREVYLHASGAGAEVVAGEQHAVLRLRQAYHARSARVCHLQQPTNAIRSSPQHFVMCRAGEGCVKDGPASRWSRCAPAPARPPARALARGTAAAHPC